MKLADYKIGYLRTSGIRHIALIGKKKSLCNVYSEFYSYSNLEDNTKTYPGLYCLKMCPKCFKKLPIKVQEEIKFRYIVWKLKK